MTRRALIALLLLGAAAFAGLGVWQVERRAWKLRLIANVDARVAAAPVAAPPPQRAISADRDTYRRVRVAGVFAPKRSVFVQAVTERGPGFWLVTPLRAPAGWSVLVNRGFVPERTTAVTAETGLVTIVGLLRVSEPGGGFLRANDPAHDRWYSRDVAAIGHAKGLGRLAPYFIDVEAGAPGYPIGGLTVVRFRNAHLVYALTWFALAGLCLFGAARVWRER